MKQIHITKTGKHTASNGNEVDFTEERLSTSAAVYDPELSQAPIVIGHPKTDDPAYGWIKSLDFVDGNMFAEPDQVEAQFEEMVKDGRFGTVSASWYTPDHSGNPSPGNYYLKHVGFLGAAAPAIKGLKHVEFSEGDDNCVTVEFAAPTSWNLSSIARLLRGVREMIIEKFDRDTADKTIPTYEIDDLERTAARPEVSQPQETLFTEPAEPTTQTEETTMTPEEIAQKEAEFAEREERIKQAEEATAKTAAVNFCDALCDSGKLLPAHKDFAVEFMCGLSGETTVEFTEGDGKAKKSQLDAFKGFLESMPNVVEFAEIAANKDETPEPDNEDADDIARRALEFQESESKLGRTITVADAVTHVTSQGKK